MPAHPSCSFGSNRSVKLCASGQDASGAQHLYHTEVAKVLDDAFQRMSDLLIAKVRRHMLASIGCDRISGDSLEIEYARWTPKEGSGFLGWLKMKTLLSTHWRIDVGLLVPVCSFGFVMYRLTFSLFCSVRQMLGFSAPQVIALRRRNLHRVASRAHGMKLVNYFFNQQLLFYCPRNQLRFSASPTCTHNSDFKSNLIQGDTKLEPPLHSIN